MDGEARLDDREHAALEFAAGQRVVLAAQVTNLLELSAVEVDAILEHLIGAGLLARERGFGLRDAALLRITGAGLRAIASRGSPPRFEGSLREAIGAGWLYVQARTGYFGPADRIWSELELRAADQDDDAPFFVEPNQFGGRPERHYPDLLVIHSARRLAVELLLAPPAPGQLEAVLRAYGADVRITKVLLMFVDPWVGQAVQRAIASVGLAGMANMQQLRSWWRSPTPARA